eukprot:TRINITY_DN18086_c5_g1_i1.p1 TRINITY_DN18086_c5_g1~~TRINITY_DN18086_c5_g1_i1.p1  ORF type:complete len:328 (+),score=64.44 TRINITY_DN18086_c5_g1_i1:63-1046(+)
MASSTFLHRKVLLESPGEARRRRILGRDAVHLEAMEYSDDDQANSSGEESTGSDANEYAEGLGYADRRHRGVAASGFAFDEHDREEYFEEPKSATEEVGRGERLPQSTASSALPLLSVLSRLESQETRGLETRRRRIEEHKGRGQSATCGTQSQLRYARSRSPRGGGQQRPRQPQQPQQQQNMSDKVTWTSSNPAARNSSTASIASRRSVPTSSDTLATAADPKHVLAEIRAHRVCLEVLRNRGEEMKTGKGVEKQDCCSALRVLHALALLDVSISALRETGIGRELAKAFWQKHPQSEVSLENGKLLRAWRKKAASTSAKAVAAGS